MRWVREALSGAPRTIRGVSQRSIIEQAARSQGIPPALLWGVYGAETNFGRNVARSSAGAVGPFQFMPGTARGLGIDPNNFRQAAFGAARYLAPYYRRGGLRAAAIAYNAGPGRLGGPLPAETQAYIPRVRQLARTWGGGQALLDASGGRSGAAVTVPGVQGAPGLPQGSEGTVALLTALAQQRPQVGSAGLATPGFAAGPRLAGQAPSSGGGPVPRPDVGSLLALARTAQGDVQNAPSTGAVTVPGGRAPGGRLGKVVVAPGANRAGVPLQPGPLNFARRIAGIAGMPVTIGTGTAHSKFTVSGNVSDHWRGEAIDIPATGARLVALGQAALIAAGMPPAQARQQRGGAYRVNGRQIIFNSNLPGYGNHLDHVHVGLSRRSG